MNKVLLSACGALSVVVSSQALADPLTGPTYPPPGGVNFSSNGILAINSGRVVTYQNFDLSATNQLYFGVYSAGLAMDGTVNPSNLTYNASLSNLANGIAVYSGVSTVNNNNVNQPVYELLTLTFTDLSNNALALTINPDAGGGLFPVLDVLGSYRVGQAFTASSSLNGSYTAAGPYFNGLQTPANQSGLLQSSITGGFYYSLGAVPEPATWAMMLVGFLGIGAAMRQSRKANSALPQLA